MLGTGNSAGTAFTMRTLDSGTMLMASSTRGRSGQGSGTGARSRAKSSRSEMILVQAVTSRSISVMN
jgi:hypothetical protein